jgi:hypothetical protein
VKVTKLDSYNKFLLIFSLFVFPLAYVSSGPIFEGFTFNHIFQNNSFFEIFPWAAGRPLTPIPWYLISIIGGNGRLGYFIIFVFHFLIIVFALNKLKNLDFKTKISLLLICTSLPGWQIFTNERYVAAKFSLSFAILGTCLFLSKNYVKSIISLILASLLYPPVIVVLPCAFLLVFPVLRYKFKLRKFKTANYFVILIPPIVYIIYAVILRLMNINSYDSSAGLPSKNLVSTFLTISNTLIFRSPVNFVALFITCFLLNLIIYKSTRALLVTCIFIAVSIIAVFVYSGNSYHLRDKERVYFIVTSIFILYALIFFHNLQIQKLINSDFVVKKYVIQVWSKYVLVISFFIILMTATYYNKITNSSTEIINQINDSVDARQSSISIRVIDSSGEIGDVNLLYGNSELSELLSSGNSLLAALNILNKNIMSVSTCREENTQLRYPISARFPLPTPEECLDYNTRKYDYVFRVSKVKEKFVVEQLLRKE